MKFKKTIIKKMCFITVQVMGGELLPTQYDMPIPIKHYRNGNYSVSKTHSYYKRIMVMPNAANILDPP